MKRFHELIVIVIPLLLLCAGVTRAANCPVEFDAKAIIQIYEAKDVRTLERRYHAYAYSDRIADVVYAVRRHALTHGGAARELLRAIPRNPIEFWSVYHFAEHPLIARADQGIGSTFEQYIDALSEVASRKSTSIEQMHRYLLLTVFSDGDAADLLAELNAKVARGNPTTFRRAIRLMKPEERRRICGTKEPCDRPPVP